MHRNSTPLPADSFLIQTPTGKHFEALRDQTPEVFEALISDLCADDFVRKGSAIARLSHRPALPPDLQLAATKIREALSKKPFNPLSRKEIALNPHAGQALRFLVEQGEIVEVG